MDAMKIDIKDFSPTTPSFLTGAGSVFNLAENYFEYRHSFNANDEAAIASAWMAIGKDIRVVAKNLNEQLSGS